MILIYLSLNTAQAYVTYYSDNDCRYEVGSDSYELQCVPALQSAYGPQGYKYYSVGVNCTETSKVPIPPNRKAYVVET